MPSPGLWAWPVVLACGPGPLRPPISLELHADTHDSPRNYVNFLKNYVEISVFCRTMKERRAASLHNPTIGCRAVAFSSFTLIHGGMAADAWRELIIGTNLGGMGTLIASMASLISYKGVVSKYPEHRGRYLTVYTGMNVVFLIALMGLAFVIE